MDDDDNGMPQLSSHALAALHEFYAEQQVKNTLSTSHGLTNQSFGSVEEDWQLSQFWYTEETALKLAEEAIAAAGKGGRLPQVSCMARCVANQTLTDQTEKVSQIACLSSPSVYQKLKDLKREDCSACLLEYDKRFSVHGDDFVFYDYNYPLDLPKNVEANSFDIVVADPPYLSNECLGKTAETIKYLTKGKILLCTGAVMEDAAASILGVKMCQFIPQHTRHLANEFRCYANYDCGLDP